MCQSNEELPRECSEGYVRDKNPLESASLLSRLFFLWPYGLLKLGMQRPLEDADLPRVMEVDSSTYNRDYIMRIWEEEKKRSRPSLQRALLWDFFRSCWYIQPLMGIAAAARVTQAVALGFLIEYFEGANKDGYFWASVVVVCALVLLFEHHTVFFASWRKGMQYRLACVAAIYEKSLHLSSTNQETTASYGKIMNLASNDVDRFMMTTLFVSHLFWSPVLSLVCLVVGCVFLGPAFAAGFGLLVVVLVPVQFYLSGRFAHYRSTIAAITDKRVTFVSQAVRGARVMKMSGYEWKFLDRIHDFRDKETTQIAKANRLKSWNESIFFCTNVVVSMAIFFVHAVVMDDQLEPGDVFMVFTLINILQLELIKHVSLAVMGGSECYVSLNRIQSFLASNELAPQHGPTDGVSARTSDIVITMKNVTCSWSDDTEIYGSTGKSGETAGTLALDDVSLDLKVGELTAIVGTVGSGKSALLQAIIAELPISKGHMSSSYESIAYASQDPWIMDGTVRENILMGKPFDGAWYESVIQSCGLSIDFRQFQYGDSTIVGDRGVQCSGGQRARIGLARALYRDAEVLVVDDPLSAVDAKVGRRIFDDALVRLGVQRGKCVVLATHQHQYVHDHQCVLVEKGRVRHVGTYSDCVRASKGKLKSHDADTVTSLAETAKDPPMKESDTRVDITVPPGKDSGKTNRVGEANVQGVVGMSTYLDYFRAMGGLWVGVCLFLLFSVTQTTVLFTVATFGRWAEMDGEEQSDWDIVGLSLGLTTLVICLATFRAFLSFQLTVEASRRLHNRMARAVLRSKIEFFDTNPLGRVLNRFSADVGSNDDQLPPTLFDFSVLAFVVVGSVITALVTLPFTIVAIPPLMWYFISVRRVFVTSTRELKRLEGLARSPIFAMLSESLGGIATIRANNYLDYFRLKFKEAHDAHTRAFFSFIAASRWVGFRMDSIMVLFIITLSYLSVLVHHEDWFQIDPSVLGLSLSMLLQLAGLFQWCIRQSAEVVNQMVSIERVLAFGKLEPEAALKLEGDKDLQNIGWPQKGEIVIGDLVARYRKGLPTVLDGVSVTVPAGSRVGIVGRTGSGKSTLTQALFRLLEPESGKIVIDGVDITSMGLHALRTNISVIPQVPTLFSGCTIRENLDLFNLHSDEEIDAVLKDCHLADVVSNLPNGTSSVVSEGGSNFSVGQRQLLCLARAILSKSKILVLDEATASVDRRTDQLLQAALRESFKGGTILAVAHRLDSIIDHDYILVMGHGKVLEYGTPRELLQMEGAFASMVADTGEAMSADLKRQALGS